ncbi:MAG: extracellular solute-binding protein [Candidatus Omnitrophica bacterium]|nr:extracellular solute-binding protein [Candidatus Omnitrophota bacterium]
MRLVAYFFCIAGLVLAAGCGQKESSSQEPAQQSKKLLMWLVGSESQARVVQEIGSEFFAKNNLLDDKEVIFSCEAVSWGNAHTKYLTCIAANVIPDIGTMGLTWGTEFGNLGAMVDLAAEFPEDVQAIKETTFPGLWQAIEYKGSVYGIAFDLSLQTFFYRNDIVKRPPETWQELRDLLLTLKGQDKGMIFDWGSISWIGYAPYLWQAGGDFYNQEGSESTLDSEQAVEALEFFAGLYTELGVLKAKIPLEQGLRTGDFPLAISGNWKIDSLRLSAPEIAGKWSIALLPAGPTGKHTAFLGGRVMGIFKESKNKQIAWEFIKFLFEPEIQIRLHQTAREVQDSYLPSNIASWNKLPMERKFKRVLKMQAEDAKGPPSILGWDESTRFIEQAIQKVILRRADARQELSKAAKELDRLLKR